jgi:hypothetical protein
MPKMVQTGLAGGRLGPADRPDGPPISRARTTERAAAGRSERLTAASSPVAIFTTGAGLLRSYGRRTAFCVNAEICR